MGDSKARVRVESRKEEDFIRRHVAGVMILVAWVVLQNVFVRLGTSFVGCRIVDRMQMTHVCVIVPIRDRMVVYETH